MLPPCSPYVEDFSVPWLVGNTCALTAGAMALVYIADTISELKLGNGTSVVIFAGIASALPSSVGQLVSQNAGARAGREGPGRGDGMKGQAQETMQLGAGS